MTKVNSINELFSPETKEIIAESRMIAVSLGCNYISTIHILLADCKKNSKDSIRNFAFKNEADLQLFFHNQRVDDPSILAETLPLTIEAERTIKKSVLLFHNNFRDVSIQPYHLFLAASQTNKTLFFSLFKSSQNLYEELKNYYIRTGIIDKKNIHESLFVRLKRNFIGV